jgi:outer membrane protein TolC
MPGDLGFRWALPALMVLAAVAGLRAQDASPAAQSPAANAPPVTVTLEEAIRRAETSDPAYATAAGASKSAALDKGIARAGLLPNVHANSQDIYVQPNGIDTEGDAGQASAPLPRFVSYDARPWEYIAQGVADETLSLAGVAGVRRANAAAAQAAAEQEIARRGLVAAVTGMFYTSLAADQKVAVAQQALHEAADFTKITREREQAREAAHADVVKAELTEQASQRMLQDAQLLAERARLELGVLLFPDPRTPYQLSAPPPPPLAPRADVEAAAAKHNPELRSALAALKVSDADVTAARSAYLPSAQLSVFYGIDANQFSTKGPLVSSGTKATNLGYATSFAVNLPIWDWLSTEHKVKQSEIRRQVAKVSLTNTQRLLIARLDEAYAEAAAARDQLASLDQSASTAAESLRLTQLAYRGGDATVLAVVDAQNAYVLAENARQDGRVRYENALATLQTLTGTM